MGPKDGDDDREELNISDGEEGDEDEGADGEGEDRGDKVEGDEDDADKGEGGDGKGDEDEGAGEDEGGDQGQPASGKRRSASVPHGRFHETNEALKIERTARLKLEEENARLRGSQQPPPKKEEKPKFDFDAKEEAYADAMIEGDKKKAAGIRREINTAIRAEAEDGAFERALQTTREERSKELLEDAAAEMCEDYPFLDNNSPEANTTAIRQVLALRNEFIRTDGMRPDRALRKAAKEIGDLYVRGKPPSDEGAEEEGDGDEEQDGQQPRRKGSRRDELAIARGARDASRQPARLPGAGARARSGAVDVEKMSETEFRNMSEREKKKARGDIV